MGLVARPVFKTGLRAENVRGGSIPPHSALLAAHHSASQRFSFSYRLED